MEKEFIVKAGKSYEDEFGNEVENVKYCNSFDNLEDAEKCIQEKQLNNYQFCKIEIHYS